VLQVVEVVAVEPVSSVGKTATCRETVRTLAQAQVAAAAAERVLSVVKKGICLVTVRNKAQAVAVAAAERVSSVVRKGTCRETVRTKAQAVAAAAAERVSSVAKKGICLVTVRSPAEVAVAVVLASNVARMATFRVTVPIPGLVTEVEEEVRTSSDVTVAVVDGFVISCFDQFCDQLHLAVVFHTVSV